MVWVKLDDKPRLLQLFVKVFFLVCFEHCLSSSWLFVLSSMSSGEFRHTKHVFLVISQKILPIWSLLLTMSSRLSQVFTCITIHYKIHTSRLIVFMNILANFRNSNMQRWCYDKFLEIFAFPSSTGLTCSIETLHETKCTGTFWNQASKYHCI